MNIPDWATSSVDPTQLSLSIESFGKSLVGIITLVAVAKGLDVNAAQTAYQQFVDQAATLVASGYTTYQAAQTMYGLLRKAFMRVFGTPATAAVAVATAAPVSAPAMQTADIIMG